MVFPILAGLASAAFSAVSAAVATIGPAVGAFCANVLPTLGVYLAKGIEVMKSIGQVAQLVATVVDIFRPNETVDDMGDRALQAAEQGITLEQFDDHAAYVEALRNFELDPEKNKDKPMEKIVAGLAVVSTGLDQKLHLADGTAGHLWTLVGANPGYFTANRLSEYLQSGRDVAGIIDYFSGKLGGAESLEVEDALVTLDAQLNPNQNDTSLRERLYQVQHDVQHPQQP